MFLYMLKHTGVKNKKMKYKWFIIGTNNILLENLLSYSAEELLTLTHT